ILGDGLSTDSSVGTVSLNNSGGASVTLNADNSTSIVGGATKVVNIDINSAASAVGAGHVSIGATHATTVGAAGGATALPATPVGYLIINVEGTNRKIPYYNN